MIMERFNYLEQQQAIWAEKEALKKGPGGAPAQVKEEHSKFGSA
jgi:hypothetical protein